MKLVVLGANGRTGRLVVREALERGDSVTAVVRSEAKRLKTAHDRLETVVGDPCDAKFLARVFQGQDAVISTLGGRRPTRKAAAIYWQSAEAIVDAAWDVGLKPVVVTSSALLFPPQRRMERLLAALVAPVVQSARRMEQTLQAAGIDVVVGRCGFLTDRDDPGYRAAPDALPVDGSSVTRRGLARFLVDISHEALPGNRVFGVSGLAG